MHVRKPLPVPNYDKSGNLFLVSCVYKGPLMLTDKPFDVGLNLIEQLDLFPNPRR